jgi:hypothetical protein
MTLWSVLLVFNTIFNNMLGIMYNMVTSFINKTGHRVIPDTLLKVLLMTNKTGHHLIRYT